MSAVLVLDHPVYRLPYGCALKGDLPRKKDNRPKPIGPECLPVKIDTSFSAEQTDGWSRSVYCNLGTRFCDVPATWLVTLSSEKATFRTGMGPSGTVAICEVVDKSGIPVIVDTDLDCWWWSRQEMHKALSDEIWGPEAGGSVEQMKRHLSSCMGLLKQMS